MRSDGQIKQNGSKTLDEKLQPAFKTIDLIETEMLKWRKGRSVQIEISTVHILHA
jgi:hypothetical protein